MRTFSLLLLLLAPAAFAQAPNPNPQLAALALAVTGAAPAAPAVSYGSPLADSIMYLQGIANADFRGVTTSTRQHSKPPQPLEWYSVPNLLGATPTTCDDEGDGHGLKLRLSYRQKNRRLKPVRAAVRALIERLETDPASPFKVSRPYENVVFVERAGRLVMRIDDQSGFGEFEPLRLDFYQDPRVLADEAAYAGRWPAAPTASAAPQIWEVRGRGTAKDAYVRYNGLVVAGELAKGSKRFHGYDDFYDGTWYSEDWTRPYGVRFEPAGTPDTVYVDFFDQDMVKYGIQGRSSHEGQIYANLTTPIAAWVRAAHPAHARLVAARQAAEARQNEQYRRDHPEAAAPVRTRPGDPSPTYQPTLHEVTCGACGGAGWVSGRNYGQRDQCGSCGGRGKVMSKY